MQDPTFQQWCFLSLGCRDPCFLHVVGDRRDRRMSECLSSLTSQCPAGEFEGTSNPRRHRAMAAAWAVVNSRVSLGVLLQPWPPKTSTEAGRPSSCRLSTWRLQTTAAEVETSESFWQETRTDGQTSSFICLQLK